MNENSSVQSVAFDVGVSVTPQTSMDVILNLITEGTLSQQDVYIRCILLPVLGFCGLLGNFLNIVILTHHGFRESTNIILVSLSVSDFCFSLTQILRRIRCVVQMFDFFLGVTVETFLEVYIIPINTLMLVVSLCHVTLISIERMIAVCFPFHVARIVRKGRVLVVVLFLYAYPTLMGFPNLFRFTFQWVYVPDVNVTVAMVRMTQLLTDHFDVILMYGTVVFNNLFSTVTLASILTCSIIIVLRLLTSRLGRARKKVALGTKTKELKAVKMLLAVCLACLIVCIPTAVLDMFVLYINSIQDTRPLYHIGQTVNDVLYQVNACLNFFIYVTMSSKFAKTYNMLFCHLSFSRSKAVSTEALYHYTK
uniref:G-protein coupled receptors family 1 profile domain-containing protein n=1 Tax=Biomphalaria glabrata TaxID=6526 RepID=A0A2C9L056_BIOGL